MSKPVAALALALLLTATGAALAQPELLPGGNQRPPIQQQQGGSPESRQMPDARQQVGAPNPAVPVVPATDQSDRGSDANASRIPDWLRRSFHEVKATDALLAAFAGLLVLYTARLWRSTERLWTEVKSQRDDSRIAFAASQRPKLIVRGIALEYPISSDTQTFGFFVQDVAVKGIAQIVNAGASPAKITESHCSVLWTREELPMTPVYVGAAANDFVRHKRLEPGRSRSVRFSSEDVLGEEAKAIAASAEVYRLYVMGFVDYEDDIGTIRRTAFCRLYYPSLKRFRPVDNSDYEYSD
jgi:hypothetical protein